MGMVDRGRSEQMAELMAELVAELARENVLGASAW
jgi:hypothetical protein